MLNEFAESRTVYIVTGYTDMRKSIDGLAAIIQGKLQLVTHTVRHCFCFEEEVQTR